MHNRTKTKKGGSMFNISRPILIIAGILFLITTSSPALSQDTDLHPIYLPLVSHDYDPTWVWYEPELVTIAPHPRNILMSIDNQGRQHLFWDVRLGDRFIYHSYNSDEGWTVPTIIAETLGTSELFLHPLVSSDGKIHLLWNNRLASGSPYRQMYAYFDGDVWSPDVEVASNHYSFPLTRLNYDDSGNITMASIYGGVFAKYYHRVLASSGWSELLEISPYSVYPTILWKSYNPDMDGGVRFYGQAVGGGLYYAHWNGGDSNIPRQHFPGEIPSWGGTVLDRNYNLNIYRTGSVPIPGGSVTGLYHRCIDQNLTVLPEQVLSGNEQLAHTKAPGTAPTAWPSPGRARTTPTSKLPSSTTAP
jgi:hypothetical protein